MMRRTNGVGWKKTFVIEISEWKHSLHDDEWCNHLTDFQSNDNFFILLVSNGKKMIKKEFLWNISNNRKALSFADTTSHEQCRLQVAKDGNYLQCHRLALFRSSRKKIRSRILLLCLRVSFPVVLFLGGVFLSFHRETSKNAQSNFPKIASTLRVLLEIPLSLARESNFSRLRVCLQQRCL